MALKDLEFNECKENGKNCFKLQYKGSPKREDIDESKVQELITKFMNEYHGDMITNVEFLRTILKDYNEKLLTLSYQSNGVKEIVEFNNSCMTLFKKEKTITNNNLKENFIVKYTPKDNISFIFTDINNKIINYSNSEIVSDKITESMQEIDYLSHVKPIVLDQESKILIEVYRLFYNEKPDFSDKNINIKMQSMLSILAEFYISIGDYSFSLSNENNIPMSIDLSDTVYRLFPLGEVKNKYNQVKIRTDVKNTIAYIGEEIRNLIELSDNQEEDLITISKVIYAARYKLASTSSVDDVSKYTDCSKSTIESSMNLVKRINKKIHND